ncbi:MAG: hypothetical protein JWN61_215, partial [Pseudonocardiales bacterium]|nr:hypothetical protein [Pseudonocardiales bacterium]
MLMDAAHGARGAPPGVPAPARRVPATRALPVVG